jgi:hypothetical protein
MKGKKSVKPHTPVSNPKQETHTEGEGSVQFRIAAFDFVYNNYFITKQATLMWRSTVLSLPLQLAFSAYTPPYTSSVPTL